MVTAGSRGRATTVIYRLVLLTFAATTSGALTGALLGWLGNVVAGVAGVAALRLAGSVVSICLLALELAGARIPQRRTETPYRWRDRSRAAWALRHGAVLGAGLFTRIGCLVFYAIPLLCVVSRSAVIGASIYASYGFVRIVSSALLIDSSLQGAHRVDRRQSFESPRGAAARVGEEFARRARSLSVVVFCAALALAMMSPA